MEEVGEALRSETEQYKRAWQASEARCRKLAFDNARLSEESADSVRRRDEFLAMLGHELRNPLAAVVNAVQVLRLQGPGDSMVLRVLDVVDRQSKHMSRLLDDLLDSSRISHGKIELRREPLDLISTLADAVQASQPLIEVRGQRLTLDLPPGPLRVRADPTRLEQVFANLLDNAARYAPPGGAITLSARRDRGEAVVRVRDNGRGIAPEMLGRIFEPFVQLDPAPGATHSGVGVGLTLVRSLVELHGGTVSAQSKGPGTGSEFTVRLPLERGA